MEENIASSVPVTGQSAAISRSGADGYANAAAFLGEMSALLSSGTFLRRNLTSNTELLTTAYRESWLAKRIIDMPSEDMTRKWYKLTTSLDADVLRSLQRLEAKHSVRQEITNAIRWARLYGGAIAVMVVRDYADSLAEPLVLDEIPPHSFYGLLVLDRAQGISPSMELVNDLNDPDYGEPEYYEVDMEQGEQKHVRIHHSRVLKFVGRELPRLEMQAENYWGASELEHIWEEIQKRSNTSANIAQLVFQANVTTLKMSDFGETLAYGTESQQRRLLQSVEEQNRLRTSFGLQLLSAEDSMETHSYSFTGLSDIYEAFMMDMAGAAEIPATKLFGRSPQGFNATGEADLRNYYDMIAQMQERVLRPALEKLLPVMAISCWGYVPEDLEIVFEPVMTTSPAERAELVQKMSSDVIEGYKAGLLTREQALEELKSRGEELGVYTKV
jgi:phage-related protein (TIGR01555 family)